MAGAGDDFAAAPAGARSASAAAIVSSFAGFDDMSEYKKRFKGLPNGQLGKGAFGAVFAVRAISAEGEALVRERLHLTAEEPLPPLVMKEMTGLVYHDATGSADYSSAEQAGREGVAGRKLMSHPGIVQNIGTYVEMSDDDVTPLFARLVLPRALGMENDGLGENYQTASSGDFWRIVAVRQAKGRPLSENAARAVALQVLSAVRFLHAHGAIHRDLKAENLLCFGSRKFFDEDVPLVQICDLGSLKFVPVEQRMLDHPESAAAKTAALARANTVGRVCGRDMKYAGTAQYLAPELLKALEQTRAGHQVAAAAATTFNPDARKALSSYGEGVDIYSIGVLVFFVLSGGGALPYAKDVGGLLSFCQPTETGPIEDQVKSWKDLKDEVLAHRVRWELFVKPPSAEAKDFILHALEEDPSKRSTAEQLLAHPWLAGSIAEFQRVFSRVGTDRYGVATDYLHGANVLVKGGAAAGSTRGAGGGGGGSGSGGPGGAAAAP